LTQRHRVAEAQTKDQRDLIIATNDNELPIGERGAQECRDSLVIGSLQLAEVAMYTGFLTSCEFVHSDVRGGAQSSAFPIAYRQVKLRLMCLGGDSSQQHITVTGVKHDECWPQQACRAAYKRKVDK
jgi:hypothetical protein